MIDVLIKLANDEIKDGTKLFVYDHIECIDIYTFDGKAFYDEYDKEIGTNFIIDSKFLNYTVELIPPKEKKYLVKLNVQGLREDFAYLNYFEQINRVMINDKDDCGIYKTHFTKDELKSIKPVREFLDDMEGKFELIEVEE